MDINILINCMILQNITETLSGFPTCNSAIYFEPYTTNKYGFSAPLNFKSDACSWFQTKLNHQNSTLIKG